MIKAEHNRFEDFFSDERYVSLKNHLYNYRLRRWTVNRWLAKVGRGSVLEIGCGLSPMAIDGVGVTFSDLSFVALRTLKANLPDGAFVVSDAASLPFREGAFSQVVCSEVLEHLDDDQAALREAARVLKPQSSLILTFPHRRDYFSLDDRFVHHYRRYELSDMADLLREAGLTPIGTEKVLGPMEKAIMLAATAWATWKERGNRDTRKIETRRDYWPFMILLFKVLNGLLLPLMWFEAKIVPRRFSSVLLICSVKK